MDNEMDFVNFKHTDFTPDFAPYDNLDIKLAQSVKYTPSQLTLLNDTLLDIRWPTFQEHLDSYKDITPDIDGWKAVNMTINISFPTSFPQGSILDFIILVNKARHEKNDAAWIKRVQDRDYCIYI